MSNEENSKQKNSSDSLDLPYSRDSVYEPTSPRLPKSQNSVKSLKTPSSVYLQPLSPHTPETPPQSRPGSPEPSTSPSSPFLPKPQSIGKRKNPGLTLNIPHTANSGRSRHFIPTGSPIYSCPSRSARSPWSGRGGVYYEENDQTIAERLKHFKSYAVQSGLSVGEKVSYWTYGTCSLLSKNWFTHIFLLLVVIGYTLLGGFLFVIIEGTDEKLHVKEILEERKFFIEQIRQLAADTPDIHDDEQSKQFVGKATQLTRSYESLLFEQFSHNNKILSLGDNLLTWNFWNAVFFCGTIYTTIGYGHITPVTTAGRVLTIVYAIFGVPLFLIVLTDFGKMFTRGIKFFWVFVRRLYYTGTCRKTKRAPSSAEPNDEASSVSFAIDDEFNLPISIAIFIMMAYILVGATIFFMWEPWTFFESFYFVFVSMATIGFGDYVPQNQMFMMAAIMYLIFGLSLTSMCINVIREKLTDTFSQASAKLGATIGISLDREGNYVPGSAPAALDSNLKSFEAEQMAQDGADK